MRHIPKSIRELLYLVRRSQGGVIKALEGMNDINVSVLCLSGACSFWIQIASKCLLYWGLLSVEC